MCKICNRNGSTRLGVCWDCATSESIIENGTDMYDKRVANTSMEKLKVILKKYGLNKE